MNGVKKAGGNSHTTLTSVLYDAVKASNRRWHKDHVVTFFRNRLEMPINKTSAAAVLMRVGALEGITLENINGKNHIYPSVSSESRMCLERFLYGRVN
tara:strand:+ start:6667 stop:6960 length:294 start_codon:yes stop_codon:yes gene_type:complete